MEITPDRLHELDDPQLVDVREPAELEELPLIEGARHIPLAELSQNADSLDKARPVVFVCRSGSRSAMAAAAFKASGYDAHTLAGGMDAWTERKTP